VNIEDHYKARYGQWAGNSRGNAPDYTRCAEEVWNCAQGMISSQCSRKRGHGPDGAYCKQHARKIDVGEPPGPE